MTITLYTLPASFPVRAVLMTIKALGLDVEYKYLDLFKGEHLKEDFMKVVSDIKNTLTPQHTVPTLIDGDFILWESRAIISYLVSTYAKDDSLYPKDTKKRALVDQRLYFDAGIFFVRLREIGFPVFFHGVTTVADHKKAAVIEGLEYLNKFLDGQQFSAGNTFTIADISLLASVTSAQAFGFDLTKFKNIIPWIERCKKLIPDYEEANQFGVDQLREAFTSKMKPDQI